MRTIITHIYNEEYLLPWWLEHHKKYFDHGIIVDFGSTDRSAEIIHDICPSWNVFPSRYSKFDSSLLEYEMMFYERQIYDWRIAVPVTEFVVGDIAGLTQQTTERTQWIIPTLVFAEYDPDRELDTNKKLWEQCFKGHHYQNTAMPRAWQCRSLHNYNDIYYYPGRHFSNENTDRVMIFKYANVLVGEPMIKRKLQVQTKVSPEDWDAAVTHCSLDHDGLNRENLLSNFQRVIGEPDDVTDMMNSVLQYL